MASLQPVLNLDIKYTKIFINNEWVNSESGKTFPTINPATEKKIADIQEGDKADVDKAVKAARAAFKVGSPWRQLTNSQRGYLISKLADLVDRDAALLATMETMDTGKSFRASSGEAMGSANTARFNAGAADKISGQSLPLGNDVLCYTKREPIGVVGAIIPWNFPMALMMQKIAPALACGCTVVVKPAEQTPLTALHLASLVKEAGFPPGVVNVVPGYGPSAGAAISYHMDVDKVTFTGSGEVGRLIMEASGKSNLKKVVLELGGKSPLVIFDDADLDMAVQIAHDSIMSNMGQICCALSRTYVQENIYDEFVKRSIELAKKRNVGDPFDLKNQNGPQIDDIQTAKIVDLLESGVKEGAKLECGGHRMAGKGYFIEPTVFTNVTEDMRIGQEEIFGPVQSIFKFKTMKEAIERANNTTYGLGAGVITKDINKALIVSDNLEAGTVWVNSGLRVSAMTPFGGYKMSGIGRELGEEGLKEYLICKTVVVKINEPKE